MQRIKTLVEVQVGHTHRVLHDEFLSPHALCTSMEDGRHVHGILHALVRNHSSTLGDIDLLNHSYHLAEFLEQCFFNADHRHDLVQGDVAVLNSILEDLVEGPPEGLDHLELLQDLGLGGGAHEAFGGAVQQGLVDKLELVARLLHLPERGVHVHPEVDQQRVLGQLLRVHALPVRQVQPRRRLPRRPRHPRLRLHRRLRGGLCNSGCGGRRRRPRGFIGYLLDERLVPTLQDSSHEPLIRKHARSLHRERWQLHCYHQDNHTQHRKIKLV
mmetsp:Transcript_25532/g.48341  ORF Transcript_25532/g.48341 Transcript_25532/m.48341 type:complete len:271 (-) Transcript_25532:275-1087(-)